MLQAQGNPSRESYIGKTDSSGQEVPDRAAGMTIHVFIISIYYDVSS